MFRESDYEPPRMHPSFSRKPMSLLQQEAQLSKFEDKRDVHRLTPEAPPAVPATYDTRVDHNHPEADWGGLVSKERTQKRHDPHREHRSQQTGIMHTEDGIVSIEEKAEWSRLRRPSDPRVRDAAELIGGVSTKDEQYMTNYDRQTKGIGTYQDQLCLAKRAGNKKVISDPAQANRFKEDCDYGRAPPPGHYRNAGHNSQAEEFSRQQEAVYGYQPRPMAGSFTKDLGSSLASRLEAPPSVPTPKPTEGGRILLSQNYKPAPGYTGRRPLA